MARNRKRRVQPEVYPQQNLDSFLDILMNVVGALIFVSLFVSLSKVLNASKIKRLPRTKNTEKNRYVFEVRGKKIIDLESNICLLYTSPSPRDLSTSRMPSSA